MIGCTWSEHQREWTYRPQQPQITCSTQPGYADLNNPNGLDETIQISSNATGGTFTLSDGTDTTVSIAYDATAATIKTRLETDITGITTATVTGTGTPSDPWNITHNIPRQNYGLTINDAGLSGTGTLTVIVQGHPILETLYYGYGPGMYGPLTSHDAEQDEIPRDWYSDYAITPNGVIAGQGTTEAYRDYPSNAGTPELLGFHPQGSVSSIVDYGQGDPYGWANGSACIIGDELVFTNGTMAGFWGPSFRGHMICAVDIPALLQAVEDNGGPIRHDRANPFFRTIANSLSPIKPPGAALPGAAAGRPRLA